MEVMTFNLKKKQKFKQAKKSLQLRV